MNQKRRTRKLRKALEATTSFQAWTEIAEKIDVQNGSKMWRLDPVCSDFNYAIADEHMRSLRAYRESGTHRSLFQFLTESLYRLNYDLTRLIFSGGH